MKTQYNNYNDYYTMIAMLYPDLVITSTLESEMSDEKPRLVKLVYNNPYTIAFWSDNTQTKATCLPEDTYSKRRGLFVCRMKKKYGSWTAYQQAKEIRKQNRQMRSLLRKIGREVELSNATILDIKH